MTDRAKRIRREMQEREAELSRRRYVERERQEHEARRILNSQGHSDCTFFTTEDGTIRCIHGEQMRFPSVVVG